MALGPEEPEPWIASVVLFPLRLVKGFFSWLGRKIISISPALEYEMDRRKRDKEEIAQEIDRLVSANAELERRLRKLEMEDENEKQAKKGAQERS